MPGLTATSPRPSTKSWLDRALSIFAEVRAGEGLTALLMLANVFLLLICYSVIKTVREPLILLGGGAEVRSYAAGGQALLLMGFVPLYGWFASRVNRARLLVGLSLFFITCIELFALAVAARVPYVGVAFFVWVGIFNMSLVAQFWSFATDLYTKEAGARIFPIIMMGMTGGAPLGSFVAARLFRLGFSPQVILQVSAVLLGLSVLLYLAINRRETDRTGSQDEPLAASGGFRLVIGSPYLRLIAGLVVLLNIVNTTGEYMVARLLSEHVRSLALADPGFNKQAFIGAFSGDYQFWVNVSAFLLQAFVASRLVKHKGLAGVLLALPLIALGGYAIVAAGVGFSVVRWIKTAENATDYSIMNTARQMLWLPASREEKYKAKQAIDTFFVRGGDVLSAAVVFIGTTRLRLTVEQFALANLVLTVVWLAVAFLLAKPRSLPRLVIRRTAPVAAALAMLTVLPQPASAQDSRAEEHAAQQAEKATRLHPVELTSLERRLEMVNRALSSEKPLYLFMGGPMQGAGVSFGPGYRARYGDSGRIDAHATWSTRNYREVDGAIGLPTVADGRLAIVVRGNWFNAPTVAVYGVGNDSSNALRSDFQYRSASVGTTARLKASHRINVGGAFDVLGVRTESSLSTLLSTPDLTYRRTGVFAEVDTRTSPGYSHSGRLLRLEVSDYHHQNGDTRSFRRIDADIQQFVPLFNEHWILAFRATASTTTAGAGQQVPYALLPDLGGSQLLRGYAPWRFRDRNRLLLSGEYRWVASPLMDMAVFVDAGKVASERRDLTLSDLHVSPGIGVRLHTPASTITRVDIARSREGLRLIFAFSPSF